MLDRLTARPGDILEEVVLDVGKPPGLRFKGINIVVYLHESPSVSV